MTRTIYEGGQISIADSHYLRAVADDDGEDFDEVPIEGLDERVTSANHLRFKFAYRYDEFCEGTVTGDGGVSLRQIIDAVRNSFPAVERMTHSYVIEVIDLDEATATLEIGIGT